MEFPALILLACIASVIGVCQDDLVPLESRKLLAVWNVGTLPHVFTESAHLCGVGGLRDFKIYGLDTVTTNLHLCPVDMTIYGNLTARYIQLIGHYKSFYQFINHESTFSGNGDGFQNTTFINLQLRNLVAPIRYSHTLKRFQVDEMQYEMHDEITSPLITGLKADEMGGHGISADELLRIDEISSYPTVVEVVRAIANTKFQKGVLESAVVKRMFGSAFSFSKRSLKVKTSRMFRQS